jgi:hypothetical protein
MPAMIAGSLFAFGIARSVRKIMILRITKKLFDLDLTSETQDEPQ